MNFSDLIYQGTGMEFIGEGLLYYDALRTDRIGRKRFITNLKNGITDGLYQYKGQSIQFIPKKTFLWKIPTADMNSKSALEQNPDNESDPHFPIG